MRKFEIGEEVTVRAWEDMKKQYGVKNFAQELQKDSLLGLLLNEILSMEIISMPKKAIPEAMKPFCGRKMRISANPEPNIYKLDGAEPFAWPAEAFEEFWKEERKDMPKLENGMVVELRDRTRLLVAEFSGEQFLLSNTNWCDLDDMDFKTGKSSFASSVDIVKVIQPFCRGSLKDMNQSERIIWEAE